MKIKMSRKYLGSISAALALSVILSGCGNSKYERIANVDPEVIEENLVSDDEDVVEEETTTIEVNAPIEGDFEIPNIGTYTGDSLVEALNNGGYDSSYEYRKQLADYLYITNYEGTEEQNKYLLEVLKEYSKALSDGAIQTSNEKVNVVYTNEWTEFDDEYEYRINDRNEVEYRKHEYTDYYPLVGKENFEYRTCRECFHKQYKEITSTKWTAVDSVYETDGTNVREHNYSEFYPVVGNDDKEYRVCYTCGFREERNFEVNRSK